MLLDMGKNEEALAEYEACAKLNPKRLNTMYGAGLAAGWMLAPGTPIVYSNPYYVAPPPTTITSHDGVIAGGRPRGSARAG